MFTFVRSLVDNDQMLLAFLAFLIVLMIFVMPSVWPKRAAGPLDGSSLVSDSAPAEDVNRNPYVYKPFLTADIHPQMPPPKPVSEPQVSKCG